MLGVYEFLDVSRAVDLFVWTYQRSTKKYAVVVESLGAPDSPGLGYREHLNEAVGLVVRDGRPAQQGIDERGLTEGAGAWLPHDAYRRIKEAGSL